MLIGCVFLFCTKEGGKATKAAECGTRIHLRCKKAHYAWVRYRHDVEASGEISPRYCLQLGPVPLSAFFLLHARCNNDVGGSARFWLSLSVRRMAITFQVVL